MNSLSTVFSSADPVPIVVPSQAHITLRRLTDIALFKELFADVKILNGFWIL